MAANAVCVMDGVSVVRTDGAHPARCGCVRILKSRSAVVADLSTSSTAAACVGCATSPLCWIHRSRSGMATPTSTNRLSWPRPPWVRFGTVAPVDDESICPVLPEGQLLLVSPPRHFSHALAARIDGRWIPGFEEVAAEAKCWAAQERFDEVRMVGMRRTAGLLLAAAYADGLEQVPRSWLHLAPRGAMPAKSHTGNERRGDGEQPPSSH